MSKKSKRAKLVRPLKQLQQSPSLRPQIHDQLASRIQHAKQQIVQGDFAGTIKICESLLNSQPLPALRVEVLSLLGLAHGLLQHDQECYDAFGEALTIDPTIPDLWHKHGLACYHLGRYAEAVRDHERAVELSKNGRSETARKFSKELAVARKDLQEAMQKHRTDITLKEYTEIEESFTQALNLMKQEKWLEAEPTFRQLAEMGSRVPAYWGNVGASLTMQGRYDEAEEALKQALSIDPDYTIARNNLEKLPEARRAKRPLGLTVINQYREEGEKERWIAE